MKTALPPRRQRGFSLVEVLVSTVVALFAALAIMQTFAVAEGYRRTGTSGGDAAFSGAIGTYLIEHDLNMAGYGINTAAYLGCNTDASDVLNATPRNFSFTLAPAQITQGVGTNPDTITIVASSTDMMPGPINITTPPAAITSPYVVTSAYGINAGDVLLLAQPGLDCTLAQSTSTPVNGGGVQNAIVHDAGSYTANGATALARYNPGGGFGPLYGTNAVVMDMGANPVVNKYYIFNHNLVVDQFIAGKTQQAIAANVVQMRAFYGKGTNGNGVLATWDQVTPVTAADWANVLAVRVALVARSANPEKPDLGTGNCTTTTQPVSVTWDDGTATNLDVSASAPAAAGSNWMCYRYRVFHITASLRNQIWTPS